MCARFLFTNWLFYHRPTSESFASHLEAIWDPRNTDIPANVLHPCRNSDTFHNISTCQNVLWSKQAKASKSNVFRKIHPVKICFGASKQKQEKASNINIFRKMHPDKMCFGASKQKQANAMCLENASVHFLLWSKKAKASKSKQHQSF